MNILVLNAGSSTLKFGLYHIRSTPDTTRSQEITAIARGVLESLGTTSSTMRLTLEGQPPFVTVATIKTMRQAVEYTVARVSDLAGVCVDAIGCRVVHGGAEFIKPTYVTPAILADIRVLADFAPLHNQVDAEVIEAACSLLPEVPVVAVFDTAFHRTLPQVAATYALPQELCAKYGLRRYGFHGISHRYVSERLLDCLGRCAEGTRLIVCHLGNGASVCALRDGISVDTSMGLTPLEGLVMGTRSGDVDPGLLLYLLRKGGMTTDALDDLLNHHSGLLGLSGYSGDARDLERQAAQGDLRSEMALEIFAYRVCKYIGAYAVALEGLDAIAFTGGIGEHSAAMRHRICRRLAFLGLHTQADLNDAEGNAERRISAEASKVSAWVIPTDEERQIASELKDFLRAGERRDIALFDNQEA